MERKPKIEERLKQEIERATIGYLVPFAFEPEDYDDLGGDYFELDPIPETMQLGGSPLLRGQNGRLVKRFALTSKGRTRAGIYQNEKWPCTLTRSHLDFSIGRISLLAFPFGIGFFHILVEAKELSKEQLLDLNEQLSGIAKSKSSKFCYECSTSREEKKTVTTSLKSVVEKLLGMQSEIPLRECDGKTFGRCYSLLYLVGSIPEEERPLFFAALRDQLGSSIDLTEGVDSSHVFRYFSKFTYVTGSQTLIILGDTDYAKDGADDFMRTPDGMVSSVRENYTTIYAYEAARQLLLRRAEECLERSEKIEILQRLWWLPERELSTEPHINTLFDDYLMVREWHFPARLEKLKNILVTDWEKENKDGPSEITVLIVTANYTETRVVLDDKTFHYNTYQNPKDLHDPMLYNIGTFGAYSAVHFQLSQTGSVGSDSSQAAIVTGINAFAPKAVIAVGVAFGKDPLSQEIGDVLISQKIADYERGKIKNGQMQSYGVIAESGRQLYTTFTTKANTWVYKIGNRKATIKPGLIVSGDKVVDDITFKNELVRRYPDMVGGEMEGRGVYFACRNRGVNEWIIVKGICDWADGKKSKDKSKNQKVAAGAAVSLVSYVLSDKNALSRI